MYILNHTNTKLSVGQFAEIDPGKYLKADSVILESAEVAYAVRAKWASLHETIPAEIQFEGDKISFETPPTEGTSEFPTATLQEDPVAEPAAVVEEEKAAEPAAVAEPEVVEEAAPAKKGGRKPAAEKSAE